MMRKIHIDPLMPISQMKIIITSMGIGKFKFEINQVEKIVAENY